MEQYEQLEPWKILEVLNQKRHIVSKFLVLITYQNSFEADSQPDTQTSNSDNTNTSWNSFIGNNSNVVKQLMFITSKSSLKASDTAYTSKVVFLLSS